MSETLAHRRWSHQGPTCPSSPKPSWTDPEQRRGWAGLARPWVSQGLIIKVLRVTHSLTTVGVMRFPVKQTRPWGVRRVKAGVPCRFMFTVSGCLSGGCCVNDSGDTGQRLRASSHESAGHKSEDFPRPSGWDCLQCRGHGHGFSLWFRKIPHAERQLGPHTTTMNLRQRPRASATEPAPREPVLPRREAAAMGSLLPAPRERPRSRS